MQDRQHRAVARRVEKLVGVPRGGQRSGLSLTVADHASHDEIGIVEGGTVCVTERVAELAAFMDRPGCFRCGVAGDAAWKGKLAEQLLYPITVLSNIGI